MKTYHGPMKSFLLTDADGETQMTHTNVPQIWDFLLTKPSFRAGVEVVSVERIYCEYDDRGRAISIK
jgi:hypothetical protein